ncbi:MAG: 16S rRNA (cytosine(1402)-N(4))-methyltransferase RsmH [Clostridiales bacterium]|nr:16S rRNA (cytosine(1402)-N(4))-methyltransferase RsmH [Candidatus Apopatousia equi]
MEFRHVPIMLDEVLDGLNIKSDGIYFDGTLGGAGHSSEILKRIKSGKLIGCDKDMEAINVASERLKKISGNFLTVHDDFKNYKEILKKLEIEKVDGILLDLGVSSYQLDNETRGFSYRFDAPLDMRMNREDRLTAKDVVNTYSQQELERVLFDYGEEPFTKPIVKNIIKHREIKPIETTLELVEIIKEVLPNKVLREKGHPAKRVFQAIRIEVNGELKNLENVIYDMIESLKSGGRIAIITFHSLEDRIVKNAFKLCSTDCICDKNIPVCVCNHKATVKLVNKKPIEPSKSEQEINTRSQSAKLRICEKL